MRLEHWFYTIPLRLRSLFRRSQIERELEEELQLHLAQRIEQALAMGKTPDEARYAALRAIDGLEQRKEECRDARRVHWVEDLLQDVRYASRVLTKTPGFTIVAALVLALGIGANTAVFTVVNAVLLQPLPFNQPARLFLISSMPTGNPFLPSGPNMVDRDYLQFRREDQAFESLATFSKEPVTLTGAGDPVVLNASTVTPDFMNVLRVHPVIGRSFLHEGAAETNVALLSDRLWHSRFGGDPTIVGKSITLSGISYAVAGVMPPDFNFQDADLWTRMELRLDPHNSFIRPVIGRLKPGLSLQQAQAELQAFVARRSLGVDTKQRAEFVARILPLKELFVADVRKLLLIFAGAVAFVFLIACANFANLLLIRGTSRRQEIAVRAAVGASRGRLVRQLLAESTMLSLTGGTLGVLLSVASVPLLLALLPAGKIPCRDVHVDGMALAFTLGLSLLTGLIFSLAPALRVTRRELWEVANEGGRSVTGRHEGFRGALVTAEIALAVVLLTGAGLLVRSFLKMRSVNPGFRSANLVAATVDLPDTRYRNAAQLQMLDDRVLATLSALPGPESVAAVNWIPFQPELVRGDFQLEDGRRLPPGFLVDKPVVSPGYFHTMAIPLLSGRGFTERDNSTAPGVVVVSESVARRLWPEGDAIGKRISMQDKPAAGDWLTIVGIVRDVRQQSFRDAPSASVYQTYRQVNGPFFLSHMSFIVQTRDNSTAIASSIRAVLHQIDPELPTQSVSTMEAIIADTMTEPRSQTRLLGAFSIVALLLAAIGIYGVLACSVAERTHEIGIRMAMGAEEKDVLWMVLRRTLLFAAGGVFIGSLGALAVTHVLSKLLFEVTPADPFTFLAVTGILVIVALFSAWIPARRAVRVHPLVALRYE